MTVIRRLLSNLFVSHPESPEELRPNTRRDTKTNIKLLLKFNQITGARLVIANVHFIAY